MEIQFLDDYLCTYQTDFGPPFPGSWQLSGKGGSVHPDNLAMNYFWPAAILPVHDHGP